MNSQNNSSNKVSENIKPSGIPHIPEVSSVEWCSSKLTNLSDTIVSHDNSYNLYDSHSLFSVYGGLKSFNYNYNLHSQYMYSNIFSYDNILTFFKDRKYAIKSTFPYTVSKVEPERFKDAYSSSNYIYGDDEFQKFIQDHVFTLRRLDAEELSLKSMINHYRKLLKSLKKNVYVPKYVNGKQKYNRVTIYGKNTNDLKSTQYNMEIIKYKAQLENIEFEHPEWLI